MAKEAMMPFAYPKPTDETAETTVDIEPQHRKEKALANTTPETNHGKKPTLKYRAQRTLNLQAAGWMDGEPRFL